MDNITLKAYGKINIGLDVTGRRADGYHLVKMIMQTVPVYDEVSIEKSEASSAPSISVSTDSPYIPSDERNIAYKAAALMQKMYKTGGAKIHIKKMIPHAAGMAGGSADAAAAIKGINELYDLKLSQKEMDDAALKLGADVPFCLRTGTYLSEGVGEALTRLRDFPPCHILIVNPGIEVSTKWAYEELDRINPSVHPDIDKVIEAIENANPAVAAKSMGNILEAPVIPKHPEIGRIKETLIKNGALGALMSGSGSSVFGIFDDKELLEKANGEVKGEGYVRFSFEFR